MQLFPHVVGGHGCLIFFAQQYKVSLPECWNQKAKKGIHAPDGSSIQHVRLRTL